MKKFAIVIGVIVAIVLVFFSSCSGTYNNLVDLEENVNLQYSQIETNLQRRMDLIPNYMETVKGQMNHDEKLVEMIAKGRSNVLSAMESGDLDKANEAIASYDIAVDNYLNFVIEKYPELSAGQAFQDLRDELAGTENRIAVSRQYYNEAVRTYNSAIKRFPTVLFANTLGFEEADYFESAYGSDVAPTIVFD